MRVLFDTSVLIAAVLEGHRHHTQAFPWLTRARTGEIDFVICAHSLAEIYSTLSGLPTKPKISPAQAWRLIQENVSSAQVIELTASDYSLVVQRTSDLGLSGGVIYDALIARAAEKANVDHLLTFNEKDYRRVLPPGGSLLLVP